MTHLNRNVKTPECDKQKNLLRFLLLVSRMSVAIITEIKRGSTEEVGAGRSGHNKHRTFAQACVQYGAIFTYQ